MSPYQVSPYNGVYNDIHIPTEIVQKLVKASKMFEALHHKKKGGKTKDLVYFKELEDRLTVENDIQEQWDEDEDDSFIDEKEFRV